MTAPTKTPETTPRVTPARSLPSWERPQLRTLSRIIVITLAIIVALITTLYDHLHHTNHPTPHSASVHSVLLAAPLSQRLHTLNTARPSLTLHGTI